MAGGGVRLPMPHGRGGSVSRRDHNQAAGNRTHLAWALKSKGKVKLIPSRSSFEKAGWRALTQRSAYDGRTRVYYKKDV